MPESKHIGKKYSASEWRKKRNKRRAHDHYVASPNRKQKDGIMEKYLKRSKKQTVPVEKKTNKTVKRTLFALLVLVAVIAALTPLWIGMWLGK